MILADVNVLVCGFHADTVLHDSYATWLASMPPNAPLALADATATGFIRLVTNSKVFSDAATASQAADFVDALIDAGARWVVPNRATWSTFRRLIDHDAGIRANLVPDAWLAALAISHGCRLATADRGFARFDGLDWFDPAG